MPLKCRILKLNPEMDEKVKELLFKENEFVYETKEIDGEEYELKCYISEIEKLELGTKLNVYIDSLIRIWNKAKGYIPVIKTIQVENMIYTTREVENYISIFASRSCIVDFVKAISSYFSEGNPTSQWSFTMKINFEEHEEDIRRKFGDFRRVYVKEMDDDLVKSAIMGGITLENSSDYVRYVRDYGGRVTAVAVMYEQYWLLITERGTFFSPNNEAEERRYELIYKLIKDLKDIGVLETIE